MIEHKLIKPPFYKWRFAFCENVYWYVENAPNPFYRFMQRVLLGIKWKKL